jgi:hypothetical protein
MLGVGTGEAAVAPVEDASVSAALFRWDMTETSHDSSPFLGYFHSTG